MQFTGSKGGISLAENWLAVLEPWHQHSTSSLQHLIAKVLSLPALHSCIEFLSLHLDREQFGEVHRINWAVSCWGNQVVLCCKHASIVNTCLLTLGSFVL